MSALAGPDTEELLDRADRGDETAIGCLFSRQRERLRRMVSIHMDQRAASRFDPSDVVQDALLEGVRKLPEYLRERPLPFYPWLRQVAWEQLVHYHRRHVDAQIRSVSREERIPFELSEHSELQLADRLVASETGASVCFLRKETRRRVRIALSRLAALDREVLTLRFLEQLSQAEAAAALGITKGAVNMRQLRGLKRLKKVLDEQGD